MRGLTAASGEPQKSKYNPTHEDRVRVETGVAFGISEEAICSQIINPHTMRPITKETLEKYFHEELKFGEDRIIHNVAGSLYRNAANGDVRAQTFLLSTRKKGWDKNKVEEKPINERTGVLMVPGMADLGNWADAANKHRMNIQALEKDAERVARELQDNRDKGIDNEDDDGISAHTTR